MPIDQDDTLDRLHKATLTALAAMSTRIAALEGQSLAQTILIERLSILVTAGNPGIDRIWASSIESLAKEIEAKTAGSSEAMAPFFLAALETCEKMRRIHADQPAAKFTVIDGDRKD